MKNIFITLLIILNFTQGIDYFCGVARCYETTNPYPLYTAERDAKPKCRAQLQRFTAVWNTPGHQVADYCPHNIANQNTNIAQLDNHRCNTFVFGTNDYMDLAAEYGMTALELYNHFISLDDQPCVGVGNQDRFSDPYDYKVMLAEAQNAVLKVNNMYTGDLPYDHPGIPPCEVNTPVPVDVDEVLFRRIAIACEKWVAQGHDPGFTCLEFHHVLNHPPGHVYKYDGAFTDITAKIGDLRRVWTEVEAAFQVCLTGTPVAAFDRVHNWIEEKSIVHKNYRKLNMNSRGIEPAKL